jgi:hypothetical protein
MTENENKLLEIVRNHPEPERAVKIAMSLMIDFLAKREVPQGTSSVHRQESA